MANKFQMSIQERLEQEASRQKTEPTSAKTSSKPSPKATPEKLEKPVKKKESAESAPFSAIDTYLYPKQQRQAKNKTFYLDEEVVTAIRRVAREQGVTDSKLVNDILRRILGI